MLFTEHFDKLSVTPDEVIKEKYTELGLYRQILGDGGNGYVHTLGVMQKKASRTNSTSVFLSTHWQTLKKQKELFFSQRSWKI